MKYDELIKDLRICASTFCESCEKCSHSNEHGDCYNGLKRSAADAIEGLQQIAGHYEESAHDYFKDVCYYLEHMPKWIPVSERLPEVGQKVLFSYRGCIKKRPRIFIGWYNGKQWDSLFATEYDVTHWMQLPEPPKEETDG